MVLLYKTYFIAYNAIFSLSHSFVCYFSMFILSDFTIVILIIMTHVPSTNSPLSMHTILTSGFYGCDFMAFRRHRYRCFLFAHPVTQSPFLSFNVFLSLCIIEYRWFPFCAVSISVLLWVCRFFLPFNIIDFNEQDDGDDEDVCDDDDDEKSEHRYSQCVCVCLWKMMFDTELSTFCVCWRYTVGSRSFNSCRYQLNVVGVVIVVVDEWISREAQN